MQEVKIKLVEEGVAPKKTHETDAAWDLTVREMEIKDDKVFYKLGFRMEIPQGYVGKIFPRSSIHKMRIRLSNNVGIIDPEFRGEVGAVFDIISESGKIYGIGERCCQMRIEKTPDIKFVLTDKELSQSERGEGGYGSTGNK